MKRKKRDREETEVLMFIDSYIIANTYCKH